MNRILALSIAVALGIALVPQGAAPVEAAEKPKPKPSNDAYLALGYSVAFGKGKDGNVKAKGGTKATRGYDASHRLQR